jgi:hypothetical protein
VTGLAGPGSTQGFVTVICGFIFVKWIMDSYYIKLNAGRKEAPTLSQQGGPHLFVAAKFLEPFKGPGCHPGQLGSVGRAKAVSEHTVGRGKHPVWSFEE